MTDKQQFMYAVNHLSRHADPQHFQVLLARLDDELPGNPINVAAAEVLATPPKKRGWQTAILETREGMKNA
ncbi:MAG: hypothetical protein AB1861_18090 [Cyanobacteriota bacterium]